jgi:hypothetical protein
MNLVTTSIFNKHSTNYQSNLFTESRQEFTELEKKIVVLVVNQIGHMALRGELQKGTNVKFQIPYAELVKARYEQISAAANSLQLKRLIYRNDKTEAFHFIVPFPSVQSAIVDGRKVIELTMFADVVPHFAELGQRYTKYDIDVMLSLSSVYAQRMFEIVSMYHNRGQYQFTYSVEQLRMMLNAPETYRFVDFKINALEVAQRELHEKAGINLTWEPSKKVGKKVIELEFYVRTNKQLAAKGVEQDRQYINQLPLHEAVRQAYELLAGYKLADWQKDLITADHQLLNSFFRIHTELNNGLRANIKNPTAYLAKSLGIDKAKNKSTKKSQPAAEASTAASGRSRSTEVKSIGSIFNLMQLDEKAK